MSVGNIIAIVAAAINLLGLAALVLKVWVSQRITVALNKYITNHLTSKLDELTDSVDKLRETVTGLATWRESMTERIERIERRENGM